MVQNPLFLGTFSSERARSPADDVWFLAWVLQISVFKIAFLIWESTVGSYYNLCVDPTYTRTYYMLHVASHPPKSSQFLIELIEIN